eukprot:snap_masked-scaffold_51-processed-gene-0.25-mRNA-1 protein AED:1.00 eAED:1.00 QI:0/-1/0/0/-1/1/1/0/153
MSDLNMYKTTSFDLVERCLLLRNYSPNLLDQCEEVNFIQNEFVEMSRDLSFATGAASSRWTTFEEAIVLRLALAMINRELKEICQAARMLGIARRNRAIDHKLKRLLRFKNWRLKDAERMQKTILVLICIREMDKEISILWKRRIVQVAKLFA